jgi:hypothetical protein
VLSQVLPFQCEQWEALGYRSKGRRRNAAGHGQFDTRDGLTFVFVPERRGITNLYCGQLPEWTHDVSFWVAPGTTVEDNVAALKRTLRRVATAEDEGCCAPPSFAFDVQLIDTFRKGERLSLCCRMRYSPSTSTDRSLSRARASEAQFTLRAAMVAEFGAELR